MIGKYRPEQLTTNFNAPGEEKRLHDILVDLFQITSKGEFISEAEKQFICMFLKNAQGDVPPFNMAEICASFNFKYLYLIYSWDLTGGSPYFKPYGLETKQIPIPEAQAELEILRVQGEEWGKKLSEKQNVDALMAAVIHEYEFEMEQVNQQSAEFQSNFRFGGSNKYKYEVMATRLRNKFIYYTAKEVFESFDNQQLVLTLNGKQIVINEQTIVHITNRHFAESVKKFKSAKSFHNENFHPKLLNKQLQVIFQDLENAGGLNAALVREINFHYKGETYRVYTNDKKNKTDAIVLTTFFIIEDPKQLLKLANEFDLLQINADLSLFQPR
ncbi:MAG: hypothetical protein V4456_16595 [Bacteroidota bacterium]